MDADRVDVLHAAYCDAVARAVAHRLEFYFFPAVDIFFDKDLSNRGELETGVSDDLELIGVVSDAAAAAAESECGTHDDRIPDLVRDLKAAFDRVGDI